MSGRYLVHVEREETIEHHCHQPGGIMGTRQITVLNDLPLPSIGDVWVCDCGQYWWYVNPWWSAAGETSWEKITEHKALKILNKIKKES